MVNAAGPHSAHVTALAFPDAAENDMRVSTRAMRQEVQDRPSRKLCTCQLQENENLETPFSPIISIIVNPTRKSTKGSMNAQVALRAPKHALKQTWFIGEMCFFVCSTV